MFLFLIISSLLLKWTSNCFAVPTKSPSLIRVTVNYFPVKMSFVETVIAVLSCALLWVLLPDLMRSACACACACQDKRFPVHVFFFLLFFCQWLWHSNGNHHLFYYPKLLNKHIIVPLLPRCHCEWKAVRMMIPGMRRPASSTVRTLVSQTHQ